MSGRIPAIFIHEFPGMQDQMVTTRLKGGAIVAILAKVLGAKEIFEFGTCLGETAMEIAENCPLAKIVTLDLPDEVAHDFQTAQAGSEVELTDIDLFIHERGSVIKGEAARQIQQLREDSSLFDPTPYLKRFDLIYIDASHSYSAVKADSEKALKMLKAGGTIIWDDYCFPGIWKYLNELAKNRPDMKLRYIYDWDKVVMLSS